MNPSRRTFLKTFALSLAALPVLGRIALPGRALAADDDLPLLKENDEIAKSNKFCLNADQPNKSCPARKSKDKKKQYCYNCQLFIRLDGDKKSGRGKCMIMPKNRVTAASWCASWVQNPAIQG